MWKLTLNIDKPYAFGVGSCRRVSSSPIHINAIIQVKSNTVLPLLFSFNFLLVYPTYHKQSSFLSHVLEKVMEGFRFNCIIELIYSVHFC